MSRNVCIKEVNHCQKIEKKIKLNALTYNKIFKNGLHLTFHGSLDINIFRKYLSKFYFNTIISANYIELYYVR